MRGWEVEAAMSKRVRRVEGEKVVRMRRCGWGAGGREAR